MGIPRQRWKRGSVVPVRLAAKLARPEDQKEEGSPFHQEEVAPHHMGAEEPAWVKWNVSAKAAVEGGSLPRQHFSESTPSG